MPDGWSFPPTCKEGIGAARKAGTAGGAGPEHRGATAGGIWLDALLQPLEDRLRFKVQALRLVDVLPAVANDADLVDHLRASFQGPGI